METYYPGSSKKKKQYDDMPPPEVQPEQELELGKSKIFLVNGQPTELYPLGALAAALNRKPVTVRKWENEGIIPNSPYMMSSHDVRGQRRLYTKQQIETLRAIAKEEGVLEPNANGKWKSIESTDFRAKAVKAFR